MDNTSRLSNTPSRTEFELERGRAARRAVPRRSHGEWARPSTGVDPVAALVEQDRMRAQDLVPIRHGRMAVSAFTFYRGAAAIMAADLAGTPASGLEAQLCGDAHLSNLGVFASPERNLLFDLNDFDETLRGPWEWDLKRLATSFVVAARDNGFEPDDSGTAASVCARAYREAMRGFAESGVLATWYARASADEVAEVVRRRGSKGAVKATGKALAKSRSKTSVSALEKLTEDVDGRPRFMDQSPLLVPLRSIDGMGDPDELRLRVIDFYEEYLSSLADDHRHVLTGYRITDIAHKVVGVGSVGMRAFIVLLEGRGESDPLVLQFKEATTSVLEAHLGAGPYPTSGERVVRGQRMMQSASDIFLGWSTAADGRHYYWRQLRDMKGSADVGALGPKGLAVYAEMCGWSLARAHARSGDCVAIGAYLGKSASFDDAVTSFALAYAAQNEADHQAHLQAIADGAIPAESGV